MAKFVPVKTTNAKLATIPIREGQLIFVEDRMEGYIDCSDTVRISIGSVLYIDTELNRMMISNPVEQKIYYVSDSEKLYVYISSAWVCLNPSVITEFIKLTDTPSSYTNNGGKILSVKLDESGLEFTNPNSVMTKVSLAAGTTAVIGNLLCLTPNGYALADNTDLSKINDIMMCASIGDTECMALEFGYIGSSGLTAGSTLYLATNGTMSLIKPTSGYVKVIGYAVNSGLIKFKPDSSYTIAN